MDKIIIFLQYFESEPLTLLCIVVLLGNKRYFSLICIISIFKHAKSPDFFQPLFILFNIQKFLFLLEILQTRHFNILRWIKLSFFSVFRIWTINIIISHFGSTGHYMWFINLGSYLANYPPFVWNACCLFEMPANFPLLVWNARCLLEMPAVWLKCPQPARKDQF